MSDQTAAQAIREAAWQQALKLYHEWEDTRFRANGGMGGAGYRNPFAVADALRLRTLLDAVVAENGFEGTRADPMLNWAARQAASWDCPK